MTLNSALNPIITYLNVKFHLFGTPKIKEIKFDKQLLSTAYSKENSTPTTIDKKLHWKFELVKKVSYSETFVTILKEGRVWGNEGFVINNQNILFDEVSRHFEEKNGSLLIFKHWRIIKPQYKDATVAVIAASGARVYYHWMMDIVPRVELLIKGGHFDKIDYFIVEHNNLLFQKELLKKLNIENKIIPSNDFFNFHIKVRDLIIPSFVSDNDTPSLEACLFVRKLFSKDISTKTPFKKIYIQRKKGRIIVNEQELLAHLTKQGFEIVELENLSVANQATLFSETKFVVAPHGAGLTNIVFCQPGTKVIDIFSPEWVNPCYYVLASNLNLNYAYMIGEGETFPDYYDPKGKGANIVVDTEKFCNLLKVMEND